MYDKWHKERQVAALRRLGHKGLSALGLYCYFWSWCIDDPKQDGWVPAAELTRRERALAELLVEHELWISVSNQKGDVSEGYFFIHIDVIFPNLDALEQKRSADRTRIAGKRAEARARREGDVARDSHATNSRVAPLDLDPDQDPEGEEDQGTPPSGQYRTASRAPACAPTREGEGENACSVVDEPPEWALEATPAPAAPEATREPSEASEARHRAAARAAWGDGLDFVLRDLKPDNTNATRTEGSGLHRVAALAPRAPGAVAPPAGAPASGGGGTYVEMDPWELATKLWARFRAHYERRFERLPYMQARNAGDFAERVASIARSLGEHPVALFDRGFEAWLKAPPKDEVGRNNPYANFVMRFEGLVTRSQQGPTVSEKDRAEQQMNAALARGDHAEYERLNAAYAAAYLGGRRAARPAN